MQSLAGRREALWFYSRDPRKNEKTHLAAFFHSAGVRPVAIVPTREHKTAQTVHHSPWSDVAPI
jgi:hypothetical protein